MASLRKNYIYNLTYQVLTLVTPFITTPYVSRVLEADNIGINSYVASIVNYFTLFGVLGMGLFGQREIAFYQKDIKEKSKIFWNLFIMRFCTVSFFLVAYLVTVFFMRQYQLIFQLQTISIICCYFECTWFLAGEENFKVIVNRDIVFKALSVILVFVLVKTKDDLWKMVLMNCGLGLLGNISIFAYVLHKVEKVSVKELSPFKYFKPVLLLFIPQIAIEIYTVLDKSMIGFITKNPYENGCYEQAMKLIRMLTVVVTSLGTVIVPRMAALYAEGEMDKLKGYITKSFTFVLALALPMLAGLWGIADIFVPIFFGSGYDKVVPLLKILSFLFIIIGFSNVIGMQFLIATKKEKAFTISVTVGAGVNFCLNIFMITLWGAIGAAIASVIAEFSVTLVQYIYAHKTIDKKGIAKGSIRYLIASACMFALLKLMKYFFPPSLPFLLLMVAVCAFIYAVLIVLMGDTLFVPALKRKIFRK